MRQAASSQQAGTPQGEAEARRAADRLKEAQQTLSGLRSQEAGGQVDDLARQAEELASRQQDFEGQMRRAYGPQSKGVTRQQAEQLAGQREGEIKDLKKLEQDMQNAVRDLMSTERKASTKLREALGDMQQAELPRDMQRNADWIRRGMGELRGDVRIHDHAGAERVAGPVETGAAGDGGGRQGRKARAGAG